MKDVTEMVKEMKAKMEALEAEKVEMTEKISKLEDKAEVEVLQAAMKVKDDEIASLNEQTSKMEELEKDAKKGKEDSEKLQKVEADQKKDHIETSLEGLKKEGHIDPKDESRAKALMESGLESEVIKLSVPDGDDGKGSKDIESTPFELLEALLKSRKTERFTEISKTKGDGVPQDNEGDWTEQKSIDLKHTPTPVGDEEGKEKELEDKIAAYMAKNDKATYADAMIAVSE